MRDATHEQSVTSRVSAVEEATRVREGTDRDADSDREAHAAAILDCVSEEAKARLFEGFRGGQEGFFCVADLAFFDENPCSGSGFFVTPCRYSAGLICGITALSTYGSVEYRII